jgi:riboflavin kinase/FMN adenylyltransferase
VEVLRPGAAPQWLTPLAHQKALLARAEVAGLLAIPFDRGFSEISAEEFIRRLAGACRPLKRICVGYGWRFGKGRHGDVHLLADLGQKLNFEFTAIPHVEIDGEKVSSTAIRRAVAEGDLALAERYLGRRFSLFGEVVRGDGRGRTIGFPTANVAVVNGCLPPNGVYAVRGEIGGASVDGVANLGVRPTVEHGRTAPVFEVHLIGWDGDLYGQQVEISFHQRLRGEQGFPGIEALREQIAIDIQAARSVL